MLLAIDIGNTLIDFGFFEGNELKNVYKVATRPLRSEDEYKSSLIFALKSLQIPSEIIESTIISCVVPSLTPYFARFSKDLFGKRPLVVGPGLPSGVTLKVDNPLEVGSDLVADAAGARALFGNDLFIADLGTASKYIYVDSDGAFAGLAIAPGYRISIDALVQEASALTEISLVPPKKVIGKNTADCMNSGLAYGTAFEIHGFANAFEKEVGHALKRILTGGNAPYVAPLLPGFEFHSSVLLEGLRVIAERKARK